MMQVVVAGCDDVTAPPPFHPFIRIDFPARVVEHGVYRHHHEQSERDADMQRNKQGHHGKQPRRADGLYRIE